MRKCGIFFGFLEFWLAKGVVEIVSEREKWCGVGPEWDTTA